jgi:hypothetical protein
MICYEGSANWYVIDVPSGDTLLDIAAGYGAAANSPVQLDVKAYYLTTGTKTLTLVQELTAATMSDAGTDSIQTTLHAVQSGSYYLQVADAHNVNFDANNSYTLTVDYAVDPDSHEPNDTTAQAKPSDSKPGYLAYLGDLDIFETSVANANDLLTLSITNPTTASASVSYSIASSTGTVLTTGSAPPQAKPYTTQLAVSAAGTYYVTLSSPAGTVPSHAASSGYTITFGSMTNPDTLNNHTIATAACPGGGSGPCSMAFSGTTVTLPSETAYITVPGQRDFYRVDVTSGAALVLQMKLTSAASTPVKYAVDLLTPDPNSACTADTDCQAMNLPCTPRVVPDAGGFISDTDCELSHACLDPGNYKFCSGSTACSLCQGAGLCIQNGSGSGGVCAVPQYLSAFTPGGTMAGGPTVSTAQPLFSNGTYYVNVHDASYQNTDLTNPYTLTLEMAAEPDPNDQSTVAAMRNNFYDPYPSNFSDEKPNIARAVDITSQLQSGTPVTGYISYQSDNDWYKFQHPCPGQNCALDFTWTQPGPSNVHVAFYMLNDDLSLHESFSYSGTPSTLSAPVVSSFDNQSCSQCSFASATVTDAGPYTYYLRVADVTQKNWDFSSTGQYSVTVTKGADGCPSACSEGTSPPGCYCFCSSSMSCPSPNF